jgi:hypothetical protein
MHTGAVVVHTGRWFSGERRAQNACLFAVESMLLTAPMPRARSSPLNGSSQLTIDNVSETRRGRSMRLTILYPSLR